MIDDISIARRFGLIVLLDVLLFAAFGAVLYTHPDWMNRVLPGHFGFGADASFTGNYLVVALILLLTALLILLASFFSLMSRLSHGVLVGPKQLQHWLRDDGAVAVLAEEQTTERQRLQSLRRFFLFGALLLFIGMPLVSYSYAQANPQGAPIFQNTAGAVSNPAVTIKDAALFTADQIIAGITIGISDQYGARFAPVTFNNGNAWYMAAMMVFRIISLLVALVMLFTLSRTRALKAYVAGAATMVMADVAAAHEEAVQDQPVLREDLHAISAHHHDDAHGHEEPLELAHHEAEAAHEEHHAAEEHGHGDHGHGALAHDEHAHTEHGHDAHGHEEHHAAAEEVHGHGHDAHAHQAHGHGDHGHDDHGKHAA